MESPNSSSVLGHSEKGLTMSQEEGPYSTLLVPDLGLSSLQNHKE